MKIAYILFNGITWLDLIGIYDPISRLKTMKYLPDLDWDLCSFENEISDNFGLMVSPQKIKQSLEFYDIIIVPGGLGTRTLRLENDFIAWLQTAQNAKFKISICTGSLLLGAAGFLKNRKATTNFQEYETLAPYCSEVLSGRIVEDRDVITAGAVSCSLDLGLYLCKKWAGIEAMKEIRKRMDYFPSEF